MKLFPRSLVLAAVVVAGLMACATKADEPQLEFATVGFVLHLPPAMQQALDALVPGFQSIHTFAFRSDVSQAAALAGGGVQPLFATLADFDGDGTQDAIVEGAIKGDTVLHVIAIMNGAKPRAIDVVQFPVYDADAVGVYIVRPTGAKPGSFQVVNYPDSTMVYQYSGGTFVGTKLGS